MRVRDLILAFVIALASFGVVIIGAGSLSAKVYPGGNMAVSIESWEEITLLIGMAGTAAALMVSPIWVGDAHERVLDVISRLTRLEVEPLVGTTASSNHMTVISEEAARSFIGEVFTTVSADDMISLIKDISSSLERFPFDNLRVRIEMVGSLSGRGAWVFTATEVNAQQVTVRLFIQEDELRVFTSSGALISHDKLKKGIQPGSYLISGVYQKPQFDRDGLRGFRILKAELRPVRDRLPA